MYFAATSVTYCGIKIYFVVCFNTKEGKIQIQYWTLCAMRVTHDSRIFDAILLCRENRGENDLILFHVINGNNIQNIRVSADNVGPTLDGSPDSPDYCRPIVRLFRLTRAIISSLLSISDLFIKKLSQCIDIYVLEAKKLFQKLKLIFHLSEQWLQRRVRLLKYEELVGRNRLNWDELNIGLQNTIEIYIWALIIQWHS